MADASTERRYGARCAVCAVEVLELLDAALLIPKKAKDSPCIREDVRAALNILDTIGDARRAFEIAGRGCLVRMGEDEPRYATVAEIAARLEPHPDATMLLKAVSEAVERYDPSTEAAILLEVASGYQVLILSTEGYDYVGRLAFEGYGLLGLTRG